MSFSGDHLKYVDAPKSRPRTWRFGHGREHLDFILVAAVQNQNGLLDRLGGCLTWRSCSGVACVSGPTRKAIRPGCGDLAATPGASELSRPRKRPPAALPAGRLKLATRPSCTGSKPTLKTIDGCGRLRRNCRRRPVRDQQRRRKLDQLGRERRQTIEASPAYRYSLASCRPTTNPRCSNPSRNPVRSGVSASAERLLRYPMTDSPGCAVAPNGASAAAPPISARSSRRLTL